VRDVAWCNTDGTELSDEHWAAEWSKSLAVMLNGKTLGVMDDEGKQVSDDSFLILVNASDEGVEYTLPVAPDKTPWRQVLDTENIDNPFCEAAVEAKVIVGGRAIRVYGDGVEKSAEAPVKKKLARTV